MTDNSIKTKDKQIKIMKYISSIIVALTISLSLSSQTRVFYVKLVEGEEIPAHPIKEYKEQSDTEDGEKIIVYPEIEYQTITGIGGAFNEIGALAVMSLPEDERAMVMANIFGENGAQFSFCRTAIGSSDFGVDAYSYSEVPQDYKMEHFTIERDLKSVVPVIKMACKYNPDMRLFASPWSPPAWMKYSALMDQGRTYPDKNKLIEDPKIFEAYGLYFAKYVEAYTKAGVKIDRLLIQNETDINTKYPSCFMPPQQMYELVKNYVQPIFNKFNLNTELWAGTFRVHGPMHAIEFASQQDYLKVVDGIGIQYTKPQYINEIATLSGDKPLMHTEGACFNGKNSVKQAYSRLAEVASYLNYNVENYCYWNMILDETGKSGWDWKQNSLLNINQKTKEVIYNPDYAVMALLSKYMQPGANRIACYAKETLISIKQGDDVFLFVQNESEEAKKYYCIERADTVATATVPPMAVAVITY
jgi:glucosylceramidase